MSDDPTLGIKVDAETKRQLRIEAAKRDMNMSEFVRALIDAELGGGRGNQTPTAIS